MGSWVTRGIDSWSSRCSNRYRSRGWSKERNRQLYFLHGLKGLEVRSMKIVQVTMDMVKVVNKR